jgi:hypothetical protein
LRQNLQISIFGWKLKKISKERYLISYEIHVNRNQKYFAFQICTNPWIVTDLSENTILRKYYGFTEEDIESFYDQKPQTNEVIGQ